MKLLVENVSKFVDIHCHHRCDDPNITEILVGNIKTFLNSSNKDILNGKTCLGLHPWDINLVQYQSVEKIIKQNYMNPDFFALGEIGLDKSCRIDYEKQKLIFESQISLASELNIPRIIIHSVRSHSDILNSLKRFKTKSKILIHDYYGNIEIAEHYLRYDCYFSFGKKIFFNSNAKKVIKLLPIDRILLETDDQQDFNIFDIYDQASKVLNLKSEVLLNQLYKNYKIFSS